jgi:hypothetical protein
LHCSVRFRATGGDFAVLNVRQRYCGFNLVENFDTMSEYEDPFSPTRRTCENVAKDDCLAGASRQLEAHALRAFSVGCANAVNGFTLIVAKGRGGHRDHPRASHATALRQASRHARSAP